MTFEKYSYTILITNSELFLEPVSASGAVVASSISSSAGVVSSSVTQETHDTELHNVSNSSEEPADQNVSNQTVMQASPIIEAVITTESAPATIEDQENIPSRDVPHDNVVSNLNFSKCTPFTVQWES